VFQTIIVQKLVRYISHVFNEVVPICIFWCVWKERNLRCFEDLESSMEDILASLFHTLTFFSSLSFSFADFLVRFSIPS
jgi:hypothetical protein